MDIGEVMRRSGLPATTLHLWERRGLIEPTSRKGLRRQYAGDILERLALIIACKGVGFSLNETKRLLGPDGVAQDRTALVEKRQELLAQRERIDRALDGLEHAITCDHENILECPRFKEKLRGVLPVHRGD